MKMFRQYPVKSYFWENKDNTFLFRNFFIKIELLEYLKDNPRILTNYILNANERADVLAHKLYGNSDLHWTIYLVNDILDPRDWVKDSYSMDSFIKEKYNDPDYIAFTSRMGEHAQIESNRFMVEKNPFNTVDSNPDTSLLDPLTYDKISVNEFENNKNDSRRVVKAIRKEFIMPFLIDFERKIKKLQGK